MSYMSDWKNQLERYAHTTHLKYASLGEVLRDLGAKKIVKKLFEITTLLKALKMK